jgi:hypothetical protein
MFGTWTWKTYRLDAAPLAVSPVIVAPSLPFSRHDYCHALHTARQRHLIDSVFMTPAARRATTAGADLLDCLTQKVSP